MPALKSGEHKIDNAPQISDAIRYQLFGKRRRCRHAFNDRRREFVGIIPQRQQNRRGDIAPVIGIAHIWLKGVKTPFPYFYRIRDVVLCQEQQQTAEIRFCFVLFVGNIKRQFKMILYRLRIQIYASHREILRRQCAAPDDEPAYDKFLRDTVKFPFGSIFKLVRGGGFSVPYILLGALAVFLPAFLPVRCYLPKFVDIGIHINIVIVAIVIIVVLIIVVVFIVIKVTGCGRAEAAHGSSHSLVEYRVFERLHVFFRRVIVVGIDVEVLVIVVGIVPPPIVVFIVLRRRPFFICSPQLILI